MQCDASINLGGLDNHPRHSLEIDEIELEKRDTTRPQNRISSASRVPVATPTPPTLSEEPTVSGEAFLERCRKRASEQNFMKFHGSWQKIFDGLLNDTLTSQELREAAKNSPSFAKDFPLMLGDIFLRITVDANQPQANDGWRTKHDFLLMPHRKGGYVLNHILANKLQSFARRCVIDFHETPFVESTDQAASLPIHGNNIHRLPPCRLDSIDTRKEFLTLCQHYAQHEELPDNAENPARTNAFRAALRHAIGNVTGLSAYDISSHNHLIVLAGKLKREVRTNALYHLRKFPHHELDYPALLESNSDLAGDANQFIDSFVRFCAREFIQQQRSSGQVQSR